MTLILGEGPTTASIALIGEAPGADELRSGRPFTGRSGMQLDAYLKAVGLDRATLYITNVVKEHPPHDDFTKFGRYITGGKLKGTCSVTPEYTVYERALYDELAGVPANVLVPMGNWALYALTRKWGIEKWRGSQLTAVPELNGRKVIPTFHPAYTLRDFLAQHPLKMDLRRIKEHSTFPELRLPLRTLRTSPTFDEAMAYIAACHTLVRVGFDIEIKPCGGTKDDPETYEMTCFSLAHSATDSMCIPILGQGGCYWPEEQHVAIMAALARLLIDKQVLKTGQNLNFDTSFMLKKHGIECDPIFDTMIAQRLLLTDLPLGLDFLTAMYTEESYYKDEGKTWRDTKDWGQFYVYSAKDSALCMEIAPKQMAAMARACNEATYRRTMHSLPAIAFMQQRGVLSDEATIAALKVTVQADLDTKLAEILAIVQGKATHYTNKAKVAKQVPFNEKFPNSAAQCQAYFYGVLGHPPYKQRGGGVSTDDEALIRLSRKGCNEASLVLAYREQKKLMSAYLNIKLDSGRFKCQYKPVGAATGRLSSASDIFGYGCVTPDTEVLTPQGWVQIAAITNGDSIAVWDKSGKVLWEPANRVSFDCNQPLVQTSGFYHDHLYTLDHRIPTLTGRNAIIDKRAVDLLKLKMCRVFGGGELEGQLTVPKLKLLVAAQADGYFSPGGQLRFNFSKERKLKRIVAICAEYGVPLIEHKPSKSSGQRRFYIQEIYVNDILTILGQGKEYGSWVLQLTLEQKRELLDELHWWDGLKRGESTQYFTTLERNAYWISTLANVSGYASSIRINNDNNNGYGSGNNLPLYTVAIRPRNLITLDTARNVQLVPYNGKVHCLVTSTSYFLIRRGGHIVVTGNTNLQTIPREGPFKKMFLADPGYAMIQMDMSQAEARILAYCGSVTPKIKAYETGTDVYALTASKIAQRLGHSLSYDDILAQHKAGVMAPIAGGKKSWRGWGKECDLALGYGMGADRFSRRTEMPLADAKLVHTAWHLVYPEVRNSYHAMIQAMLRKDRTVMNPFGRRRKFLGPKDDIEEGAFAHFCQSTVADAMMEYGLIPVMERQDLFGPLELLLQVHDALVWQVPLALGWQRIAIIATSLKAIMEQPITWQAASFRIPVSTAISGVSLGHMIEVGTAQLNAATLEGAFNRSIASKEKVI